MKICAALAECLKEQGWTVARLAREAQVTELTAHSWVDGTRTPRGDRLVLLCAVVPGLQARIFNAPAA